MPKNKRSMTAVLSLLLCLILCSCGDMPDEIQSQAEDEQETPTVSEEIFDEVSIQPSTIQEIPTQTEDESMNETIFYIKANGTTFAADFADNSSADALRELLHEGDLTIDMHDYGSFEKVGEIGHTLPQNNAQITTEPGDIILYLGTNITIYYDENSWDFTRLGKIQDVTKGDLLSVFGDGNVTVTLSLTE